jgi:hypothetical protein
MASLYADLYGLSDRFELDTLTPAMLQYEQAWFARYPRDASARSSVPFAHADAPGRNEVIQSPAPY